MPTNPGDIVDGRVVKLLKYGAIVELEEGESGLVHISEIADEYVRNVTSSRPTLQPLMHRLRPGVGAVLTRLSKSASRAS